MFGHCAHRKEGDSWEIAVITSATFDVARLFGKYTRKIRWTVGLFSVSEPKSINIFHWVSLVKKCWDGIVIRKCLTAFIHSCTMAMQKTYGNTSISSQN